MAIALDGFDALRRIGETRRAFAAARSEAAKAARAIVVTCLKAKTLDLDGLRAIADALGAETFAFIAHDLKDSESLALLKRLDPHRPELASSNAAARAAHLVALAQRQAAPVERPAKAKTSEPKARAPKRIESALMKAFAASRRTGDTQDD